MVLQLVYADLVASGFVPQFFVADQTTHSAAVNIWFSSNGKRLFHPDDCVLM